MINRRMVLGFLASASTLAAAGGALAQKDKDKKEKKPKKHQNGRQLLGEKIKQNGKHKLKAGKADVEVEVKGGKVAALTAQHPQKGSLPVRKVKSKQKLADATPSLILASAAGEGIQLAQYSDWYYGYWFEEDENDWYYWFTADEVYADDTWVEYTGY